MTEEILFSKYRVVDTLKTSEKSRVLLAVNQESGSLRILKEIQKDSEGLESAQAEISILKDLTFPGIPHIYDVEESEKYYYVIEEYIEGETLEALVRRKGTLTLEESMLLVRPLIQILKSIHSNKPDAVLHLDIQPKNIMINQTDVYLIDFGNAVYVKNQNIRKYLKGTQGFAAPEQYHGDVLSFASDVYGAGACMAYMLTGVRGRKCLEKVPESIRPFLEQCMEENPKDRIQDMEQAWQALLQAGIAFGDKEKEKRRDGYPKDIFFAGTQGRIGTSYLALGFTGFLRRQGISAVYQEENTNGMVAEIARYSEEVVYKEGAFWYQEIPMYPLAEHITFEKNQIEIIVRDMGKWEEKSVYGQNLVLVAGERVWERAYSENICEYAEKRKVLEGTQTFLLWNLTDKNVEKQEIKRYKGGYCMPYIRNLEEAQDCAVYKMLLGQINQVKGERWKDVSKNKGFIWKHV